MTLARDANSREHAGRIVAEPFDRDQFNPQRAARRARFDKIIVDGGGIGCPKCNGNDREDSREVHFVNMFEISELGLVM